MARKEDGKKQAKPEARRVITPRFVARVVVIGILLVGAVYAWNRTERFLIRDARFAVALPDYGLESPSLQITGVQYASRVQVLRIFAPDYGRSLYLLPIRERREQLRAIDWIKDASVARIWPNRVLVQVTERDPVAFVNVPSPEMPKLSRIALIDAEGKILQAPAGHPRFAIPVARGISLNESQLDRRGRVRRLTTLMKDLGELSERVSEVDVTDPDDLRVTTSVDHHAVVLMLGDHNFQKRFENFINHYSKIQERLANATILDLRLEDRITVVEGKGGN
jgi:cell division protein FtsQ